MASSILDMRYVQAAFGSIKVEDLPASLKSGLTYQATRTVSVARDYFLLQVNGFKQLTKLPSIIDMGMEWRGLTLASPRLKALFDACGAARKVITVGEIVSKMKGVVNSAQYSVFTDQTNIPLANRSKAGLAEWALTKGAEVADWTMSAVETHKWLAKVGFVAGRAWVDSVFNFASICFVVNTLKNESAKWYTAWYTGHIVDSKTGALVIDPATNAPRVFGRADAAKSAMITLIALSYLGLTTIAVLEAYKYQVAHVALLNFAFFTTAVACTVGQYFWEELVIKQ